VSAGAAALIFGLEPDCSGGPELSLTRRDCPEPPARGRQDVKPQAERSFVHYNYAVSSPGSTGRSSVPETAQQEPRGRGVLDAPVEPDLTGA